MSGTTVNPYGNVDLTRFYGVGGTGKTDKPPPTGFGAGTFDPSSGASAIAKALGLPEPQKMSNSDLAVLLQSLKTKNENEQLKSASEDVQVIKFAKKQAADERMKQLEEMAEKAEKANKGGELGKIFGWIAAAAMVIAGAILIATGAGAAAGVGLLVGGVCMMATMALQETGAMDKMLDGMGKGLAKMFEAFGMEPEEAAKAGRITATVIVGTVIIAAAVAAGVFGGPAVGAMVAASFLPLIFTPDNLEKMGVDKEKAQWASFGISLGLSLAAAGVGIGVGAYGAMKGVELAGKLGPKLADLGARSGAMMAGKLGMTAAEMTKLGGILGYTTMGVQAATTVAGGAVKIDASVKAKESAEAEARAKEFQADLMKLQKMLQEQGERIDEIIKRLQEGVNVVMDILNQQDTTSKRVANV
jgi:hypothetical protein